MNTNSIEQSDIELLENNLTIYCPVVLKGLNPGLNETYIEAILQDSMLSLDNIKILYSWRNGFSEEIVPLFKKFCFHPCGNLLSLEDAVQRYTQMIEDGLIDENLFPFISNNDGDYLLLDIGKDSETYGMIYICSAAQLIHPPHTIYDNFQAFVKSLTHCYASKAYIYRKRTNEIELNSEYELGFSEYFNPRSEYWKGEGL